MFLFKLINFVFSVLNFVILTTSLSTTSFNFFKSIRTVFNSQFSISSTFVFKLFKLVRTLTNLAMPNLSTSAFKAIKSFLAAKSDVPTPVASYNSFLVAILYKSNSNLILF